MLPAQHVLWFDDAAARAVDVAGGKGANLAVLTGAGIPVPAGFIVSAASYREVLTRRRLDEVLRAEFAPGFEMPERGMTGGTLSMMVEDWPDELEAAVLSAYHTLGAGLVAVRSSATSEDQLNASFAGQYYTLLNIRGDKNLTDAIRNCYGSMFEPRAMRYRESTGIDHLSSDMAVVVQRMVQSERSGVAFSCDPLTHDHSVIVIEAVRGLGEALVSGAVTPDMYVVDKATMTVLERTVVEQKQELALGASDALDQTAWRDIPAVQRTRPKLSDEEIVRLAEAVARVEHFYQAPQDIEWAYADQAFYVLQSRPITTLAHAH